MAQGGGKDKIYPKQSLKTFELDKYEFYLKDLLITREEIASE